MAIIFTTYGASGVLCICVATITCIISFVTPYWLQSWPRIHTPFRRLGLWEFCLSGLLERTDPKMKVYYGCWWIFTPEYWPIHEYLMPWWFRLVQFGVTISMIIHIACLILSLVYSCRAIKNTERRALISLVISWAMLVTGCLLFCVAIIFGARCQDRYWMPYPTLNWPSWSYGMAVMSGFFSYFASFFLFVQNHVDKKRVQTETYNFPMSSKSIEKLNDSRSTII